MAFLEGGSLKERYPGYEYVFSEFDVDRDYVDNPEFIRFALQNEKKIKAFYTHSLKRGELLLPLIQRKLMDGGLTDLFIYLSMIESGFSPKIASSKKAVGLWQFMPKTAGDYKLNVQGCFDERCDPVSATEAAIKHLRRLYVKFGKWYLAVLAYNCGEGRLSRAIEKAGTDELEVLIDPKRKYLPKETIAYIQKILLVAMIGENEIVEVSAPEDEKGLVQVEVNGGTELTTIAKMLEMPEKTLKALNPAFRNGVVPKSQKHYPLLIPEHKMVLFYMKYDDDQNEDTVTIKPYLVTHNVVLGDTLEHIAQKYHTSTEEIMLANRLETIFLEVNSTLVVPVEKEIFEGFLQK